MKKETAYLKIPFSVLSQADLTLSTKVLLAQILEYSKLGSCFATNSGLSRRLGISDRVISKGLCELKKKGCVTTRMDGRIRRIYPAYSALRERGINIANYADSADEQRKNSVPDTHIPQSCNANSAHNNNIYNNKYKNNYNRRKRIPPWEDTSASYDIEELEKIR